MNHALIRLREEEVSWARECAAAGDSPVEIASELGLDAHQVLAVLGLQALTPRQAEACSLWCAGASVAEIAKEMGLCCSGASKLLRRARASGYPLATSRERADARAKAVVQARQLGRSYAEISERHGLGRRTIERIIERARREESAGKCLM